MYPCPPPFRNDEPNSVPPAPSGGAVTPSGDITIGRVAITCGLIAWFGETLLLLADLGRLPRAVMLDGASLIATAVCWMVAVVTGLYAALVYRSRAGRAACLVCLMVPMPLCCLSLLGGGFWLD